MDIMVGKVHKLLCNLPLPLNTGLAIVNGYHQ